MIAQIVGALSPEARRRVLRRHPITGRSRVRLVDAFSFVLGMFNGPQPAGLYQFCSFDAFCSTSPPDIHPTASGYAAMAQMFFEVSGHARMVD